MKAKMIETHQNIPTKNKPIMIPDIVLPVISSGALRSEDEY
jgi:hypothetical protein